MNRDEHERLIRKRWGRAIRQNRRRMDLTQDEFRRLFPEPFPSQSTIQRWEDGEAEPRIKHRVEMARIFEVPAALLFPLIDRTAAA